MSDLIVIQPQVTELTVTEDVNQVVVSSVGVQGPTGATGATGAKGDTGDQGPSGVIAVTAPITNSGTSTSANIGIDLSDIASKYQAPWYVKYLSGYYYEPATGSVITTGTFAKNRVHYVPFFLSSSITIDRIGAECTAAIASTVYRLGIYNSNSDGYPSSLILDAGTIDTSTTGAKEITISQALTPGLYYFASVNQGSTGNPTMRSYSPTSGMNAPVGASSMQTTQYASTIFQASVGGALPATASGLSWTTIQSPRVQFRVA